MDLQSYFKLKAGAAPCTVLHLLQNDLDGIQLQLTKTVEQAPDFFRGVPVVLDLEKLHPDASLDFFALKTMLISGGLVPVGVRHPSDVHKQNAIDSGLPVLSAGKLQSNERKSDKDGGRGTLSQLVTSQVRSGAQLYAKNADLVVIAPVSPGAELLADGNIHIYGPLRGRALAGVQGNLKARIFCKTLEAELISIAGFYMTRDDMQALLPLKHDMIQVYLDGEQVKIESV